MSRIIDFETRQRSGRTLETLPAMREIDKFLREAGCVPKGIERSEGGYGCTVNRVDYVRGNENIFIITNDGGA